MSTGLTATGSGILTLSGTNSYTGGTIVNGGELILTSATAVLDGSNLTVGDPGAFPAPIIPSPTASSEPDAAASIAAVPEPGALALLAACAAVAASLWTRMPKVGGRK
jgi:autotransporter-associated beta strand protein